MNGLSQKISTMAVQLSKSQCTFLSWIVASGNTGNYSEINATTRRRDDSQAKPFGEVGSNEYLYARNTKLPALVKSFIAHQKGGKQCRWRFDYKVPKDYNPTNWLVDHSDYEYLRPLTEQEYQVQSKLPSPTTVKFQEHNSPTKMSRKPTNMNMKSMGEALNKPSDRISLDSHGNPYFYGRLHDIAKGTISDAEAQFLFDHAKQLLFGVNHAFFNLWFLKMDKIKDESNTMNLQAYDLTIFNVTIHQESSYKLGFAADSNVFLMQVPSYDKLGQQFLTDAVAEIQESTTGHFEQCRVDEYSKQMERLAKKERETLVSIYIYIYDHISW